MVDIQTYRLRIGCYNPGKPPLKNSKYKMGGSRFDYQYFEGLNREYIYYTFDLNRYFKGLNIPNRGFNHQYYESLKPLFLFYLYVIMIMLSTSLLIIVDGLDVGDLSCWAQPRSFRDHGLPFLSLIHVKLSYFVIISFVCNKFIRALNNETLCKRYKLKSFTPANIFFGCNTTRIRQILSTGLLAILTINFLMIAIVNPSMLNPGPQNISIYYQNVQGLIPFSNLSTCHPILDRTKILELNTYINFNKPAVVMLTETWLKKSITNNEVIESSDYNIFRNDRSQTSHPCDPSDPKKFRKYGGGVLIGIRSDIEATSKRISLRRGAEIVAIEVTINDSKFVFCCCYRVGTLGHANHGSIEDSIGSFFKCKKPKKIFILGDFNLSSVTWPLDENITVQNATEKLFVDSFNNFGLLQYIEYSTHIKGKTLDLLLTNHSQLITNFKVLDQNSICKSDHFPITFEVKSNIKHKKPIKRKIYNFKHANWDALNHDLCYTNWNAMLDCTEPEIAWSLFKSTLFHNVNKYIPTITIKSEFKPPWFDSEVYEAFRDKARAHKKFKRTKNDLDGLNFANRRREFKRISCRKMRDNMYNTDDPALITKKFWSHCKYTSKSQRLPECLYLKNCYRNNPLDKANMFNNYFFEQFSDSSAYDIDIDWSNDDVFEISFCHRKIRKLLSKINSNKAFGPDGIHGKILKNCAVSLAYPLSILFKLSYNTGCIPKEWKLAHVVPVHKKGSKENIENYRPISLTSLVMKTFERILKDEILLHTNHLLDSRQHGFLSKKSCTTNMAGFCDDVALSLNDCLRTDVVYFDFAKAFDSVNHDLILKKLKENFKIDGRLLKFLVNYLGGREQCVTIGNVKSSIKPVLSGVPQGSILGPILFVLFINDLPVGLNPDTGLALYADDTKIWRTIYSDQDHALLQNDIAYLNSWATLNKMNFHPQKCKVVSIAHRPPPLLGILPNIQYFYTLGDSPLDYVDSEKDLGVDINSNFNFNDQCERVLSKANQQFGLTKRTCYFVNDIKRKRTLYLTLIRSQFEHCSPIWRPFSTTMLDKLEGLQKRCVKWILSEQYLKYNSYITYIHKCRQVNLLPLTKRFELNDLILFHKILYNLIHLKLPDYLSFFDGNSRLRSCHLDNLSIVNSLQARSLNTNCLKKSFFYRTHTEWNALPLDIRKIENTSSFKIKVIKYFWKFILPDSEDSDEDCLSDYD